MKIEINFIIFFFVLVLVSVFVSSSYTPDSYDNITLVLNGGYTPDTYDNITLILGEETELNETNLTECGVLDNSNWVYNLMNDVNNSGNLFSCFVIAGNNITFNGNNFTIDANGGSGIGSFMGETFDNITIDNVSITNGWSGVAFFYGFNNSKISNVNITNVDTNGIALHYFGCSGCNLDIINTSINSTSGFDIDCQENLINMTNVTGTSGYPIEMYVEPTNIQDKTLSQLCLYNADNSNITNITLLGGNPGDDLYVNGIVIYNSDNCSVRNFTINNTYYGVYLSGSSSCNIDNGIINGIDVAGIYLVEDTNITVSNSEIFNGIPYSTCIYDLSSGGNYFINNTIYDAEYGIDLVSYDTAENNLLTNLSDYGIFVGYGIIGAIINNNTIVDSNNGIHMYYSKNATIYNNYISNNTVSGILFESSGSPVVSLIYNNYFNNTLNNKFVGTVYNNTFNTTNQTGSRIDNATGNIGGNFYAYPNGTGHSETCTDSNSDGFCDEILNVSSDGKNVDYLPLAQRSPETTFYIYIGGGTWADETFSTIKFRCRPTQTNCEPVNQNVGSSQSIYKICNSGKGYGNSVVMNMNTTVSGIDLKCDDDYTSADATILTTSNQTISSSLYPDSCVYISCWADYDNPTSGGLFKVNAYVI